MIDKHLKVVATPREYEVFSFWYSLTQEGKPKARKESCKNFGISHVRLAQIVLKVKRKIQQERDLMKQVESGDLDSVEIKNMKLSVRCHNCLRNDNIYTLKDLKYVAEHDSPYYLLKMPNFGRKSLRELLSEVDRISFNTNYDTSYLLPYRGL